MSFPYNDTTRQRDNEIKTQQDNEKKRQRDESQNLNLPSIHSYCYFCCSKFNHFSHFSHALSCKALTLHWRGQLSQSILKRKLFPTIPRGGPKARVFSYSEEKGRSKTLHNDFWADAEFGWSSLLQFCFATIPMGSGGVKDEQFRLFCWTEWYSPPPLT